MFICVFEAEGVDRVWISLENMSIIEVEGSLVCNIMVIFLNFENHRSFIVNICIPDVYSIYICIDVYGITNFLSNWQWKHQLLFCFWVHIEHVFTSKFNSLDSHLRFIQISYFLILFFLNLLGTIPFGLAYKSLSFLSLSFFTLLQLFHSQLISCSWFLCKFFLQ